ncbi:NAD(P)/FAD-dependent oxidoreductase [Enterococcus olivae]
MKQPIVDVVIIGGGPAGLYAAFYGGLRDLKITVLEAQEALGGKINFYPEKFVWDVGALPPTKGHNVRQHLIDQATTFDAQFFTGSKAIQVTKEDSLFHVTDEHGRIHLCRTVLFAVGGGIVSPKKITAPVAEEAAPHVYYTFPDYQKIKGERIVVSGGGDAAVDYANECLKFAKEVFIAYRGAALKAHEAPVAQFKKQGGQLLLNADIQTINEGTTHKISLVFRDQTILPTDHLLIQHGHDRDRSFLDTLDFPFEKEQDFYFACQEPTVTNIPGLFAAGDIQYSKGKLYLLASAFQEAANSINQIKRYLDPQTHLQAMVSSHNKKFDSLNQALIS